MLYELLSSDSLDSLLNPAISQIILRWINTSLHLTHPVLFRCLCASLYLPLELYFLAKHSCSLSESFYGISRGKLSILQIFVSLIHLFLSKVFDLSLLSKAQILAFSLNLIRYPSFIFRILKIKPLRTQSETAKILPLMIMLLRILIRPSKPIKHEVDPPVYPIRDHSICLLCSQKVVNPAAVRSSYVFCYTCIHKYVKEKKQCPVTFIKLDLNDIKRIYVE